MRCSDFLLNNHTVEPRLFEPKSPLPGNEILPAETKAPKRLRKSTIEQAAADVDAKKAQADFAKVDAERYRVLAQRNDGTQDDQKGRMLNER